MSAFDNPPELINAEHASNSQLEYVATIIADFTFNGRTYEETTADLKLIDDTSSRHIAACSVCFGAMKRLIAIYKAEDEPGDLESR